MWIALVVIAAALLLVFALVGIPQIFRGSPVDRVIVLRSGSQPFGIESTSFPRVVEIATRTRLEPGATIEILCDGDETFPRMWADMRAARDSITIVNYYATSGRLVNALVELLVLKATEGVRVFFVYDPIGSSKLGEGALDLLRQAGVHVAEFRPLRWYRLDRANHRTHVRSVVIDGRVGYTGGFGFADYWLGSGDKEGEWRDTNVRVLGPPVRQLQALFESHWVEATGDLLLAAGHDGTHEPATFQAGNGRVFEPRLTGVVASPASIGSSVAERLLALTLGVARRTLYIANAYFVPDADFSRMLCEAAARGVDVRILTNGGRHVDVPITWRAGRHRYEQLLSAGVRIYEFEPTVMHAKTIVADGEWCIIGTINFDNRSMAFNEEVAVVTLDRAVGEAMAARFFEDLGRAREIDYERFRRRGLYQRALETGSDLLSRWM